jgi:phage terminase large subunit GpA-like protein
MTLPTVTAEAVRQAAAAAGARPDPLLSVSQWADRYRILSQRASSEPGPWRTDRTPYLRDIMDCLSPSSPVERVVFMKAAQIGATECGNNWIGYVIHHAPGPIMAVQPTVEMAKRNSKQRIDPLIEESDALRALVREARSRDSGSVMVIKGDARVPALLGTAAVPEIGPLGLKLRQGLRVWPVNSGMAKEELYRWLRQERPTDEDLERGIPYPPGYCHFPKYSEEYFKQLTAEQLITKTVKGYRRYEWQKMRERNDALDVRAYARAAAGRIGMDRFQEQHWVELERRAGVTPPAISTASPQSPQPPRTPGPQPSPRPRVRFRM